MLAASLFFIVLISSHHVLCGATEWFYARLGRTGDAFEVILDFFKRTSPVAIAYVGLLVFDILLFIMVVSMKKLLAEMKVEVAEREKKPPEVGAPSKRPSMGVDD